MGTYLGLWSQVCAALWCPVLTAKPTGSLFPHCPVAAPLLPEVLMICDLCG